MGMRLRDCTVQPIDAKSETKKVKIIRNGCPLNNGLTKIEYRSDHEIEFQFVNKPADQGPVQLKFSCEIRKSTSFRHLNEPQPKRWVPGVLWNQNPKNNILNIEICLFLILFTKIPDTKDCRFI